MKRLNRLMFAGVALFVLLFTGACTFLMEETPRSEYTPEFFETPKGVENGVISLYADMRYVFGQYFYGFTQGGTDEMTFGQSADNNLHDPDRTVGFGNPRPTNFPSQNLWNTSFRTINTANGIIEFGVPADVDPALIAEARFFRGWAYFMLAQTYGGAPLDLGGGELKFNRKPTTTSVRNTVPEVYAAVFKDLEQAVTDLPVNSRKTGTVNKTTARLFLSKAYLTFAWWLENPNDIPTYPEAARVDVSESPKTAGQYFQLAYDVALQAIKNPGENRLMETYFDVHHYSNERNLEMLLYADHYNDERFGGGGMGYGDIVQPQNNAVWMHIWNYTGIKAASGENTVQRAATQELGRPWTRTAPPIEVFTRTFADKTNDSRYDGTFTTTLFGNLRESSGNQDHPGVTNANGLHVAADGAMLKFLPDVNNDINFANQAVNTVGGGELPGESAWVVAVNHTSRIRYPSLWKLGPQRPDNGSGLGTPNGSNPRPFYIARFAELYLIAAEAAVKGATGEMTARQLVNVLRERAGKWKHKNAEGVYKGTGNYTADFSAQMVAATPTDITIDYILSERSREFYGEGYRWYDLVRTQTWADRAEKYTIVDPTTDGKPTFDAHVNNAPKEFTRVIDKEDYLCPIPQGQIDAMEMSAAEKAAYQNPGW